MGNPCTPATNARGTNRSDFMDLRCTAQDVPTSNKCRRIPHQPQARSISMVSYATYAAVL
jgi:hypothetical protein